MYRILLTVVIALGLMFMVQACTSTSSTEHKLEDLFQPLLTSTECLPKGCNKGGLKSKDPLILAVKSNPYMTKNPKFIEILIGFMPSPGNTNINPKNVSAAFVSTYKANGTSSETGIYALYFKDPSYAQEAKEIFDQQLKNQGEDILIMQKESLLIYLWREPVSTTKTCFRAIRECVEGSLAEETH